MQLLRLEIKTGTVAKPDSIELVTTSARCVGFVSTDMAKVLKMDHALQRRTITAETVTLARIRTGVVSGFKESKHVKSGIHAIFVINKNRGNYDIYVSPRLKELGCIKNDWKSGSGDVNVFEVVFNCDVAGDDKVSRFHMSLKEDKK